MLRRSVAASGNVTISPDSDGVYRRVPLVFGYQELSIPHFLVGNLVADGVLSLHDGALTRNDAALPLMDDELVLRMTSLAIEEASHLRRVVRLLHDRGLKPARRRPNPYVQGLLFGDPMSSDNYLELLLAQVEGTDQHRGLFA